MSLVTWDNSFKLNIHEIDDQDKKLIDFVNSLHEVMKEDKSNKLLGSVLDALLAYTKIHFNTQERMLIQNKFPYIENHKIEHKKFITKIETFRSKFENGQAGLAMEVLEFLSHWLGNHIKKVDAEYTKTFVPQPV